MSSTYSALLRTELIGTGDQSGAWGDTTNNNFQYIFEQAIAGYVDVVITPTTDKQALTWTNGPTATPALDQSVHAILKLSAGTVSADFGLYAPPASKTYIIWNNSGYTATVYNSTVLGNTTAAGSGVAVPTGAKVLILSDGTNFYYPVGIPQNGGTGQTSYTNGQLLIGNTTTGGLNKATLTAGSGITITNSAGGIQIDNASPIVYPGAGVAVSTGSAWGTSLTAPSGALVGTTDTQTLTNKRVTSRVSSATTATTLTPNSSNFDQYCLTALASNLAIVADTGSPTEGQRLIFRFKDNGTVRTLTWTTGVSNGFRAVGITLPTVTVANKTVYIGCIYNTTDSRWDAVALAQEA